MKKEVETEKRYKKYMEYKKMFLLFAFHVPEDSRRNILLRERELYDPQRLYSSK